MARRAVVAWQVPRGARLADACWFQLYGTQRYAVAVPRHAVSLRETERQRRPLSRPPFSQQPRHGCRFFACHAACVCVWQRYHAPPRLSYALPQPVRLLPAVEGH